MQNISEEYFKEFNQLFGKKNDAKILKAIANVDAQLSLVRNTCDMANRLGGSEHVRDF